MEEYVYYTILFDIYKGLLTDNEIECFNAYYCEDFSMQEIADYKNVSRSAISKNIRTVIDKLNDFENKLHMYVITSGIKDALNATTLEDAKKILEKLD